MPESYGRFRWLARLARASLAVALAAICLAVALTVAYGVVGVSRNGDPLVGGLYVLAVLAEIALAMALMVGYGAILARATSAASLMSLRNQLKQVHTVVEANGEKLALLAELAPLSDQAKAMIYHDREIEAVQEIVHGCLIRREYDQAEMLINRVESQMGYHEQAQRLRDAVAASRQADKEGEVAVAVQRVNEIIEQKNWDRAVRETARLAKAFPRSKLVAELPKRIADQRNGHKRDLLQQYDQAVQGEDVDRSIELLRELDRYLTPTEAAALQESARGIFRAKLHSLGVQFAIAVTEQRWEQATEIGGRIVADFPNSRMAAEVGQKLDALRQLAGT